MLNQSQHQARIASNGPTFSQDERFSIQRLLGGSAIQKGFYAILDAIGFGLQEPNRA